MAKPKTEKKNVTQENEKSKNNENEFSLLKTLIIVPITKTQSIAGRVNITGQLITGILTAFTIIPSALDIVLNIVKVICNTVLSYNNKTIIDVVDNSASFESLGKCLIVLSIEFFLCSGAILVSEYLKKNRSKK